MDEEISIGDFVLTGGEIPAMAVADAVCRLVPVCSPTPPVMKMRATGMECWRPPSTPRPRCGTSAPCPPSSCPANTPRWTSGGASSPFSAPATAVPTCHAQLDLTSKADRKLLRELEEEIRGEVSSEIFPDL